MSYLNEQYKALKKAPSHFRVNWHSLNIIHAELEKLILFIVMN